jgi:hypothetical protein
MTPKNPSYKKTYYNLVTRENLEGIKKIIENQGYYDPVTINKIQYDEINNLPHFFIIVDSPDYTFGHYAMLDGIYLEVDSIIPQWTGIFYLGMIITRKPTNEKIKQFIDPAKDLEHELNHLHRLIDCIDKNPDYIERSMKYNVGSCTLGDLDKSIEFEVGKIFLMEVPTLGLDFDMGQNDMFSYDQGIVTKITPGNKEDFLRYQAGHCLAELHDKYVEKFPEHVDQIKNKFTMEVNKQGKTLFGDNCMMSLLISLMEFYSVLETEGSRYEVGEI